MDKDETHFEPPPKDRDEMEYEELLELVNDTESERKRLARENIILIKRVADLKQRLLELAPSLPV